MNAIKVLHFKTNINCGGCIAKVTPYLDAKVGKGTWQVATENRDKILTITNPTVATEEIISAVKEAGYKIESVE